MKAYQISGRSRDGENGDSALNSLRILGEVEDGILSIDYVRNNLIDDLIKSSTSYDNGWDPVFHIFRLSREGIFNAFSKFLNSHFLSNLNSNSSKIDMKLTIKKNGPGIFNKWRSSNLGKDLAGSAFVWIGIDQKTGEIARLPSWQYTATEAYKSGLPIVKSQSCAKKSTLTSDCFVGWLTFRTGY
jgi:hypothetical protein